MKLWSIQTEEVYNEVMKNGYCIVKKDKCDCLFDDGKLDKSFDRSYKWLVVKMDTMIKRPKESVELPWWAYHTCDGKRDLELSDLDYCCTPGKEYMMLELDVPDDEVVLSDLDAWHFVLNNWWLDDSLNEDEWNKNNEWFNTLEPSVKQKLREESWNKIFNIKPFENEWVSRGKNIQATFWVLRKEYIKNHIKFIGREIPED